LPFIDSTQKNGAALKKNGHSQANISKKALAKISFLL
jgi:hypothetical protein